MSKATTRELRESHEKAFEIGAGGVVIILLSSVLVDPVAALAAMAVWSIVALFGLAPTYRWYSNIYDR